jgi:hypothetical protein
VHRADRNLVNPIAFDANELVAVEHCRAVGWSGRLDERFLLCNGDSLFRA